MTLRSLNLQSLVSSLKNPVIKLANLISVNALDGRPLSNRSVTYITKALRLDFTPNHSEHIQFYVHTSIHTPLVLGLPWFHKHNPVVVSWSKCCAITSYPKTLTARLPSHRPWDCAIELLKGSMPPRSRIYPLSEVETRATEEYMTGALWKGLISRIYLACFC